MTMVYQRSASLVFLCVLATCGYPALVPFVDAGDGGAIDTAIDTAIAIDTARTDRKMLVLIDTTGSMSIVRIDAATRFEAAQKMAKDHIRSEAAKADGLAGVAIYTFRDTGIIANTAGFVDPVAASNVIDTLVLGTATSPLAASLCDTIDVLVASGDIATIKLLDIYIDGGENSTPSSHVCFGAPSNGDFPPFDIGSWQNKVWAKAANSGIRITSALFVGSTLSLHPDPEAAVAGLSDSSFFSALAQSTGGQFQQVFDDKPLPDLAVREHIF